MAKTSLDSARGIVDYELLFDCVHCGLCLEACPTYAVTRAEMDSPRGRIYLMKALADGRIELDSDAVRHLDLCLGCRGCETACPSGVRYGRLIEQARGYVERVHRRPLGARLRRAVIGALFPYPRRMKMLLMPLRLLDRVGLRPALRAVAPRSMRGWIDLLPPPAAAAQPYTPRAAGGGPAVAVHHGCVAQVMCPSANFNSERMLADAGYRVVRLGATACCGALDLHAGNTARALRLARENVRAIEASPAQRIVSAASGCATAMAEYGELLKDDAELSDAARRVASKVSGLSSLLVARLPSTREFRCTITYHDACHLVHGLGISEAPRKLLASIPGVKIIEMDDSEMCCGSAGSYNLTESSMARELVRRKADNIIATGAEYVVMANPGCQFQIAAELRRRQAAIHVIHLADFVAMAAGHRRDDA